MAAPIIRPAIQVPRDAEEPSFDGVGPTTVHDQTPPQGLDLFALVDAADTDAYGPGAGLGDFYVSGELTPIPTAPTATHQRITGPIGRVDPPLNPYDLGSLYSRPPSSPDFPAETFSEDAIDLSAKNIDATRLLSLVSGGELLLPQIVTYQNLSDTYRKKTGGKGWDTVAEGIHTWGDLLDFAEEALRQAGPDRHVEIHLDQWNFPTLDLPPVFIDRMTAITRNFPDQALSLVWKGDPLDPPVIYRFGEGEHNSSRDVLPRSVSQFWTHAEINLLLREGLASSPELKVLFESLSRAHHDKPDDSMGKMLARVIEIYNAQAEAQGAAPISLTGRTRIFGLLRDLQKKTQEVATTFLQQKNMKSPAGLLYFDPVSTWLRAHPARVSPDNGWYSVGAGQMVAALEFARARMDEGDLPLDFRIMADNRSLAPIWEINTQGQRHDAFGEQVMNDFSRRSIYVVNQDQRLAAFARFSPGTVSISTKTGDIKSVMTDEFVAELAKTSPAVVLPAKAYDGRDGTLPYINLYSQFLGVNPQLADNLLVMGGYYMANDMLAGKKVDITFAAAGDACFEGVARVFSPYPINSSTGRTNGDRANIKFIKSREMAAFLNAGGANKNFLTYLSARRLMKMISGLPSTYSEGELQPIRSALEREKLENIEVSEEIIARISSVYGLVADHLWSPKGLKADFKSCLPADIDGFIHLLKMAREIAGRGDLKALQTFLVQVTTAPKLGSRNCKDGIIDHLIEDAFLILRSQPQPAVGSQYQDFYKVMYPPNWVQEGRSGIGPLILFAGRHQLNLPDKVIAAWNAYHPEQLRSSGSERSRDYSIDFVTIDQGWQVPKLKIGDEELREPFGLPRGWVRGLSRFINFTLENIAENETPNRETILASLHKFSEILSPLSAETGRYPLVTKRFMVLKDRVEALMEELDPDNPITPERLQAAVKAFGYMLSIAREMFDPSLSVTDLLSKIRRVARNLYKVELEIDRELRTQLDLDYGRESGAHGRRSGSFSSGVRGVSDVYPPIRLPADHGHASNVQPPDNKTSASGSFRISGQSRLPGVVSQRMPAGVMKAAQVMPQVVVQVKVPSLIRLNPLLSNRMTPPFSRVFGARVFTGTAARSFGMARSPAGMFR